MFLPRNHKPNSNPPKSPPNSAVLWISDFIIKAHPPIRPILVCQKGPDDRDGDKSPSFRNGSRENPAGKNPEIHNEDFRKNRSGKDPGHPKSPEGSSEKSRDPP